MRRSALLAIVLAAAAAPLRGQDTVRVGITYQPGVRPGLVVLPAPGLDSVRAIVDRDLTFSDRFEVISLTQTPGATPRGPAAINYPFYRTLGAALAVELVSGAGGQVTVRLHDLAAEQMRQELTLPADRSGAGDSRLSIHRISDEIVRLATGQPGIAASRILFVNSDKRIWRVDSDGANLVAVTPAGADVLSPAWAPDGSRIAYMQFNRDGTRPIVLQSLASGARTVLPTTANTQNMTPVFSADGRHLMFARLSEQGAALYGLNVQDLCCVERLSGGRFAENFSPAYSPDGRRVAFVSTRAGGQQIYAMSSDGTDQQLLVSFDFGATGNSNAPDWSPDGASIAFHREVDRSPQIFTFAFAGRRLKAWTSSGRNEDPSWGPDGRHLVFISDRTGRRQLFVLDTESGQTRQIMTPGSAKLPAWSRSLGRRDGQP